MFDILLNHVWNICCPGVHHRVVTTTIISSLRFSQSQEVTVNYLAMEGSCRLLFEPGHAGITDKISATNAPTMLVQFWIVVERWHFLYQYLINHLQASICDVNITLWVSVFHMARKKNTFPWSEAIFCVLITSTCMYNSPIEDETFKCFSM